MSVFGNHVTSDWSKGNSTMAASANTEVSVEILVVRSDWVKCNHCHCARQTLVQAGSRNPTCVGCRKPLYRITSLN